MYYILVYFNVHKSIYKEEGHHLAKFNVILSIFKF